jgi:hypothetical protein
MVLIIDRTVISSEGGKEKSVASVAALVSMLEESGLDHRAALKKAAREMGIPRAEAYRRLLAERGRRENQG